MSSIKSTAQTVAALIKSYQEFQYSVRTSVDKDLSTEGNAKARAARIEQAQTNGLALVVEHRTAAKNTASRQVAAFEKARPRIKHDAADLIDIQQHWQFNIVPVIESGTTLKTFIKSATERDVLAVEKFAHGYLTASQAKASNPLELDADELEGKVLGRLAGLADPATAAGIENGYRAKIALEQFETVADLAEAEFRGDNAAFEGNRWARAATLAANMPDDAVSGESE